jgi:hypothetical protein
MKLADKIVHQTQPTPTSCTATCVAMSVGIPVGQLGVDLTKSYDFDRAGIWYAERGIWLRIGVRIGGYGERLKGDSLYLVGIRSQNRVGIDHSVFLDTRGERLIGEGVHERSHWKTYDPNKGNDGKNYIEWVDEHYLLDFAELTQRDNRYVMFGRAPGQHDEGGC